MILLPYYSLKSDSFKLYETDRNLNETTISKLSSFETDFDKVNSLIKNFYNEKYSPSSTSSNSTAEVH